MWQLVRTVVVPYVIFECALALFRIYVGGEQLEDLFQDPHWPMWYLSALFFWRLLTPLFRGCRPPSRRGRRRPSAWSPALYAGDTLDLARVLGLLPFFVLGLHATPERLERLREPWVRTAALLRLPRRSRSRPPGPTTWARTEWLYYRSQYGELDVSDGRGVADPRRPARDRHARRLVVPRAGAPGHGWFTRMGAATLVVYLFHGFVVKGAEYAGYMGWADDHGASRSS